MKAKTILWIAAAHLVAIAILPPVFAFYAFISLVVTISAVGVMSL